MVTVVRAGSKDFVATITNEDYMEMMDLERMPEAYHKWRKAAEGRHANPLFDTSDGRLWFAAFGKRGLDRATHEYIGGRLVRKDAEIDEHGIATMGAEIAWDVEYEEVW